MPKGPKLPHARTPIQLKTGRGQGGMLFWLTLFVIGPRPWGGLFSMPERYSLILADGMHVG
jgi:hypothetical protein